ICNHPNVLVIDDPEIQKLFGKEIRAATDCTVLLSHNEACGLPPMEGFAAASFALGPRRQGVPDSTIDLGVHPDHGTGFLYNDDPETRHSNLKHGVHRAAKFYREQTAAGTLDKFLQRVQHQSKRLDWSATPANKYTELYNKVTKRALLTYDRIRNAFKPMLHLFKNVTRHRDATIKATKVLPTSEVTKPSLIPDTKKGKIFQIGFNKCGTQMLYYAFTENGVPSAHYAAANRPIADTMHENAKSNKPLLHGIDNFEAYFDFEDIYHSPPLYPALTHFKLLDQQYKGSRFILNTRNPEDWITSRLSHKDPITKQKYSEILCDKYGCNLDTLIQRWRKEWDEHHKAVREYFKDRPNDLLEFNIDTDSPQKVCDFFKDKKLDPTVFKVVNKTHDKENALSNTQLVMPRPALSF
ncbi:MAG TPA: sulfotransferase, partial [Gammaproteobacteria bacterium]|nr:sulfotransferase [Gammaproteobacteria bacterium]